MFIFSPHAIMHMCVYCDMKNLALAFYFVCRSIPSVTLAPQLITQKQSFRSCMNRKNTSERNYRLLDVNLLPLCDRGGASGVNRWIASLGDEWATVVSTVDHATKNVAKASEHQSIKYIR